ncbi:DUF397 domain-containing protein [Glycomyces terrestris]|uniref:DUF397 domain-containing protein n=1 Tax=Glycomyces terrestris TaxID=2493553 RepID=A0A426UYG8_9ACTN|nr:DUF397 domain-containing protein [Glycomyces terrestris]RRR99610.1 DUF397 domain-containing protein [Glycomyces terrestris]
MNTAVTSWRKSTRSGGTNQSNCVELRRAWRKSSRSGSTNTSSCVEVAHCSEDGFHLRDSKLGEDSPVFDLALKDFRALLGAAGLDTQKSRKGRANSLGPWCSWVGAKVPHKTWHRQG